MTDKTEDSGPTPEPHDETASFSVNGSGETAAEPVAAATQPPPAATQPPAAATTTPASPPPAAHAQPAGYPSYPAVAPGDVSATAAYPTDAFGRPMTAAAAGQTYATADGNPTTPAAPSFSRDSARRRSSVGLIAALAIAALVGGASGAGIYALVDSNQSTSVPANQSQGATNVVVNNTDSVNEITAVAAKASPSVVTIEVSSGQSGGTGSGIILSEDGYVLTNTHVVTLDGAVGDATIQVKGNDGRLYAATVVGTDPISDLAVIKLTDAKGLAPIQWADSAKINVGDSAIAIGSPLGLAGTVTNGIVSALNRSITVASSAAPAAPDQTTPDQGNGTNPFDFWNFDIPNKDGSQQQAPQGTGSISLPVIQTDAAINPGNSGGALLNSKGELIGINVAIANAGGSSGSASAAGSIGVGFSIPSNLAERISKELIADGKATHGLLGASVQSASTDPSSTTVGALIKDVSSGGAAEKGGLKAGDIVTNFNGVPITDANDLTAQVRALPSGGKADLTYVRGSQSTTISVTVGELAS